MKNSQSALLGALILLLGAAAAADLAGATLRVEVVNLRNDLGDVGCAVFNSAEGFPDSGGKATKAIKALHAPIVDKKAICEFKNLPSGVYAVSVYHDENKNGQVDKNMLGIPKEGYGTSNDVHPAMSVPTFKAASFTLDGDKLTTFTVQMGY